MTDTTAILGLPYLLPSQAQKHVTHNEALRQLDALVQLSAAENAATGAPGSGASFQGYAMVARALNGAAMVLAARQTSNLSNQRAWIGTRTGATGALT